MKKILLPMFFFCGIILASCSSTTNSNAPSSNALLDNFMFDSSGHPSLGGWRHNNSDIDSTAHFVPDAPPGLGGSWSVALFPGWIPFRESVERSFFGLESGVYQLMAWTKTLRRNNFNLSGAIGITKESGGKSDSKMTLTGDTNIWHSVVLRDTLILTKTDTVMITLSGGSCEVCPIDSVLFNNITFQKLQ